LAIEGFGSFGAFQPDNYFDQFKDSFFSQSPSMSGFSDILEEEPNLAFQGAVNRANMPFNQRQAAQKQRQEIFNRFQGLQRFDPKLRFTEYMDAFDFGRERFRTPLSQREEGGRTFSPRASFVR
tara:strand:+ start:106 stop:477 length:372 start_codon:yes stop_codon:yes gene_type:complete